jgi:hypothetical protein
MLAYVFWHWRRADVDAMDYERRQRAFHDALASAPPDGFVRSSIVRVSGAPWANAGRDAYEDWYLVRDSAALDLLNDAAISASRAAPHDAAAAVAAGGTAGVYRLRFGTTDEPPRVAHWFAKPDGMRYDALHGELAPIAERAGASLWCRYMVLGPSPEFCLWSREPIALPAAFAGRTLRLEAVP